MKKTTMHLVNTGHNGMTSIPIYTPTWPALHQSDLKFGLIVQLIQKDFIVYNEDLLEGPNNTLIPVWIWN